MQLTKRPQRRCLHDKIYILVGTHRCLSILMGRNLGWLYGPELGEKDVLM